MIRTRSHRARAWNRPMCDACNQRRATIQLRVDGPLEHKIVHVWLDLCDRCVATVERQFARVRAGKGR